MELGTLLEFKITGLFHTKPKAVKAVGTSLLLEIP